MKKKENQLSQADQALFRQAMRQVKPLLGKKARAKPEPEPLRPRQKMVLEEPPQDFSFSDHEYLDSVEAEAPLEFARFGISQKQLRELRRGHQGYQATLDLHGKTVEEACGALQQFMIACSHQGHTRVLVIHGKGRGKALPILKNKLNHWLRESEEVLAFCSAKQRDGGRGALYLRLKSREKKPPRRGG